MHALYFFADSQIHARTALKGVVPSPTVSPFLIVNKPPPLLLLLLLYSRALHLLVQHVRYRDTLRAEQTHSSQLCSAWYLSVVPA